MDQQPSNAITTAIGCCSNNITSSSINNNNFTSEASSRVANNMPAINRNNQTVINNNFCNNNNSTPTINTTNNTNNNDNHFQSLAGIPFHVASRSMQFVQSKNDCLKRETTKSVITKQRKTKEQVGIARLANNNPTNLNNQFNSTSNIGFCSNNVINEDIKRCSGISPMNEQYQHYQMPFSLFMIGDEYKKRIKKNSNAYLRRFRHDLWLMNTIDEFEENNCDFSDCSSCNNIMIGMNDKEVVWTDNEMMVISPRSNHSEEEEKNEEGSTPQIIPSEKGSKRNSLTILKEDNDDLLNSENPLQKFKQMVKKHESLNEIRDTKEEKENKLYISIEQSLPKMVNMFSLSDKHFLDSSIVFSIQRYDNSMPFVVDPTFNIPSLKRGDKFVLNINNRHDKPVRFCVMYRDPSGLHVCIYPKQLKILESLENDFEYLPSKQQVSGIFDTSNLPNINKYKNTTNKKVSLILLATTHVKFQNALREICERIQGTERSSSNVLMSCLMDRERRQHPLLKSSSSVKRVSLKSIDLIVN